MALTSAKLEDVKIGFCIGGPKCGKSMAIVYGRYACTMVSGELHYYWWQPGANVWVYNGRTQP